MYGNLTLTLLGSEIKPGKEGGFFIVIPTIINSINVTPIEQKDENGNLLGYVTKALKNVKIQRSIKDGKETMFIKFGLPNEKYVKLTDDEKKALPLIGHLIVRNDDYSFPAAIGTIDMLSIPGAEFNNKTVDKNGNRYDSIIIKYNPALMWMSDVKNKASINIGCMNDKGKIKITPYFSKKNIAEMTEQEIEKFVKKVKLVDLVHEMDIKTYDENKDTQERPIVKTPIVVNTNIPELDGFDTPSWLIESDPEPETITEQVETPDDIPF